MAIDKALQKVQDGIRDLTPLLEVFVQHSIQPTSAECAKLEHHMYVLLSNLSVYKHYKEITEISPSFSIHAKISEVVPPSEKKTEALPVKDESVPVRNSEPIVESPPTATPSTGSGQKQLLISMNDKFRFINELFLHNQAEYSTAVEQFNNVKTIQECDIYFNSLSALYSWDPENKTVQQFRTLVSGRFT